MRLLIPATARARLRQTRPPGVPTAWQAARKAWLPALLLAGVAAIAWSEAISQTAPQKAARPAGGPIQVEGCIIKSLQSAILAFDRPGILGKLAVQEGDEVHEGQFLANLRDDVARASLSVARIQADSDVEIVYSERAAAVAKVEHELMEEGNRRKAGTVPQLEVRRAELNYEKTLAEVEKARLAKDVYGAKRDEAQAQLDTFRLDAPFDGFVSRVHFVAGASVRQGDPMIELVNTRKVKVEGKILARDVALVQPGAAVEVQLERPDLVGETTATRVFPGKIVFVDQARSEVGGKIRVWAEVENPDQLLRDLLSARMTIHPVRKGD